MADADEKTLVFSVRSRDPQDLPLVHYSVKERFDSVAAIDRQRCVG